MKLNNLYGERNLKYDKIFKFVINFNKEVYINAPNIAQANKKFKEIYGEKWIDTCFELKKYSRYLNIKKIIEV